MPYIAVALIAALGVGGGLSIAAQNALPDSPLYPIKINVDENIEGAFAITNAARADWDLKMLEARLAEAQTLAALGTLNAQAQTQIDNNFDSHTYDLTSVMARLNASGDRADATKIMQRFQAMLTAQQAILASSSATLNAQSKNSLVPVVAELQGALNAAAVLSSSSTTGSTTKAGGLLSPQQ